MKRLLGAWLLFGVLAVPDAVRMVCNRNLAAPGDGAGVTSDAAPQRRRAGTPVQSAARRIPPDFAAAPLRFLSTAPPDSLELLPGIGPVLAARIADARTGKSPYTTWNDLLAVRGIGPKTVERLRSLVAR